MVPAKRVEIGLTRACCLIPKKYRPCTCSSQQPYVAPLPHSWKFSDGWPEKRWPLLYRCTILPVKPMGRLRDVARTRWRSCEDALSTLSDMLSPEPAPSPHGRIDIRRLWRSACAGTLDERCLTIRHKSTNVAATREGVEARALAARASRLGRVGRIFNTSQIKGIPSHLCRDELKSRPTSLADIGFQDAQNGVHLV